MNDLFYLYRYLSQNQHPQEEDNRYNVALRALEPVLDILRELDFWGSWIREHGGLDWNQADKVREEIITGHKAALVSHFKTSLSAIIDFAGEYISLNNIDTLLEALQKQKQEMIEAQRGNEELGDLDDYPF